MRASEFTKRTKFNVNETFEQGYPLEWEESEFGDYDVTAKLPDGTNLSILFSQEGSSNNESKWVVSFYRDHSTDITGQGDALKIFATVLDALEEFTYREDPDTIMFHAVKADDPKGSRAKLYDRMVKRYASHAGYNVQQKVDSEGAGYYLQKTNNKVWEFVTEAEASDEELRKRWGNFSPDEKWLLPRTNTTLQPAATLWTAYEVIQDILGRRNVTDDEDELVSGMYYVYQSDRPMFRGTSDTEGSIEIPDLDSTAAKDIAVAAHEAYHAYIHSKASGGAVHANEKIVNNMAEKWLRKNLKGTQLMAALEALTSSRIHYGQHHMPRGNKK